MCNFTVLMAKSQTFAQQYMHWVICTQLPKHLWQTEPKIYASIDNSVVLYRVWFEWVPGSDWESVFSWAGYWNRTRSLLWILQPLLTTVQVRASHIPLTFDCDLRLLAALHFWLIYSFNLNSILNTVNSTIQHKNAYYLPLSMYSN